MKRKYLSCCSLSFREILLFLRECIYVCDDNSSVVTIVKRKKFPVIWFCQCSAKYHNGLILSSYFHLQFIFYFCKYSDCKSFWLRFFEIQLCIGRSFILSNVFRRLEAKKMFELNTYKNSITITKVHYGWRVLPLYHNQLIRKIHIIIK